MSTVTASSASIPAKLETAPGYVFTYGTDPQRRMPVFITGQHPRCLLVLGGQTNNFFSLLFLRPLMGQLDLNEWSVVQVQLSSSLAGYGGHNHVSDAEDIHDLLDTLATTYNMSEVALLAWDTGVQIAIELLGMPNAEIITRVILQGAVVDPSRDMFSAISTRKRRDIAQRLVREGRRELFLSDETYDLPVSAARASAGGYLTLQEALWQPALSENKEILSDVLGRIHVPLLILVACGSNYRTTDELCEQFVHVVNASAVTSEVHISFFDDACDEHRQLLKGTEVKHAATCVIFLQEQERKRRERADQLRQEELEEIRRSRSILAKATF